MNSASTLTQCKVSNRAFHTSQAVQPPCWHRQLRLALYHIATGVFATHQLTRALPTAWGSSGRVWSVALFAGAALEMLLHAAVVVVVVALGHEPGALRAGSGRDAASISKAAKASRRGGGSDSQYVSSIPHWLERLRPEWSWTWLTAAQLVATVAQSLGWLLSASGPAAMGLMGGTRHDGRSGLLMAFVVQALGTMMQQVGTVWVLGLARHSGTAWRTLRPDPHRFETKRQR